jgi:hypothetical protein
VSVTNLQGFINTITDLTRSGLPCAISQLTGIEGLAGFWQNSCVWSNIRDLESSVKSNGLSGRHIGKLRMTSSVSGEVSEGRGTCAESPFLYS